MDNTRNKRKCMVCKKICFGRRCKNCFNKKGTTLCQLYGSRRYYHKIKI